VVHRHLIDTVSTPLRVTAATGIRAPTITTVAHPSGDSRAHRAKALSVGACSPNTYTGAVGRGLGSRQQAILEACRKQAAEFPHRPNYNQLLMTQWLPLNSLYSKVAQSGYPSQQEAFRRAAQTLRGRGLIDLIYGHAEPSAVRPHILDVARRDSNVMVTFVRLARPMARLAQLSTASPRSPSDAVARAEPAVRFAGALVGGARTVAA
jgi:hypothetical protein